jgi:hypothetical protein
VLERAYFLLVITRHAGLARRGSTVALSGRGIPSRRGSVSAAPRDGTRGDRGCR